jgi:hypothetical protein
MKNSKLFTVIIISIICMQLVAYVSISQVSGVSTSSPVLAYQSKSANNANIAFISKSWYGFLTWFDFNNLHFLSHHRFGNLEVSPKTATIVAGQSQTFEAFTFIRGFNSYDVHAFPGVVWSINSGTGTYVWTGNSVQVTKAGTWTVTATYEGKSDTASLTVTYANNDKLDHITASIDPTIVASPNTVVGTATAFDIYGNSWDISKSATFSIPAGNDGGSWAQNVYTSHMAGNYAVQVSYGGKLAFASLTVTHSTDTSNIVSLSMTPSLSEVFAGSTQSYSATATDLFGNSWDATADISISNGWTISTGAGGYWNGASYTSEKAGTWIVKANLGIISDTASLTVNANSALLGHIAISPKTATVTAGTAQKFTAFAYDKFGNSLGDVTSFTSFSSSGGSVNANSVTANSVGSYPITATYDGLTDTASLAVNGYTATFIENGLQTGTSWTIIFNGQNYSSTNSAIVISGLSVQSYSWSTTNDIQSGQTRYVVSQTSGTLSIPNQLTQNVVYSTQYLVTYSAIGNALSISIPADEWVSSGGQATGSFPTQVNNGAQDTRCNFLSDNRTANISQPTRIIGTYQSQYYVTITSAHGSPTQASQWLNAGSSLTISVTNPDGDTSHRWISTGYSLDNTASTSGINYTLTNIQASHAITFNWQEQYCLTVNSPYGSPSGGGWYNTGSTATTSVSSSTIAGTTGILYKFANWIGDGSGTTLTSSISMTGPKTVTANWTTQYLVTYAETGNALSITLPPNEWVNSGATAQGNFVPDYANFSNDTKCIFTTDNRTSAITEPTTITGNYQTQYKVTFNQFGLQPDAQGTILTISNIPKNYSEIANIAWVDNGTQITFSYKASIATPMTNKIYSLASVNIESPVIINKPTLIQANYQAQYSTSLYVYLEFSLVMLAIFITAVSVLRYRNQRIKRQRSLNEIANALN